MSSSVVATITNYAVIEYSRVGQLDTFIQVRRLEFHLRCHLPDLPAGTPCSSELRVDSLLCLICLCLRLCCAFYVLVVTVLHLLEHYGDRFDLGTPGGAELHGSRENCQEVEQTCCRSANKGRRFTRMWTFGVVSLLLFIAGSPFDRCDESVTNTGMGLHEATEMTSQD